MNISLAIHYLKHFFTAKRNGHGVHSPFAYQLCEEVFYSDLDFYDFTLLKKTRKDLLSNSTEFEIEELGAGSKAFKSTRRSVKNIAAKGISTEQQSELLYKLSNFLNCKTVVELGTSLGLNTLYLAMVNTQTQVYSMEGSKYLVEFAQNLARQHQIKNINIIHASFDKALPKLLNDLSTLDLFYVDGNHTYEATLHYFNLALEKKNNTTVFVFDDIYWSSGMTKAWKEIKKHPSVTLSIDTFYFGLIFFREEIKEKRELKFFLS